MGTQEQQVLLQDCVINDKIWIFILCLEDKYSGHKDMSNTYSYQLDFLSLLQYIQQNYLILIGQERYN